MYYDKDEIKNSLTMEDAYKIIDNLGGNPSYSATGFLCETLCHNEAGTGSRKLYYYENTKLFQCYTGCGFMDIFEVIMRNKSLDNAKQWTLYNAMDYIVKELDLTVENHHSDDEKSDIKHDLRILTNYAIISKIKENIQLEYKVYDDNILKNLSFMPPKAWIDEGITIETMKKYNIKYYGTEHKIVIPHYNLMNELIGIRGRAMISEDADMYGKYMPLKVANVMYTHPLSHNLYGLNLNIENIRKIKKIVIFEGEKSVLLYDSLFGTENNIAVATCGSSLSLFQQSMIIDLCNVDEVVIAYDKEFQAIGDANFDKSTTALSNLANKLKNYCNVSIMFDKYNLLRYKDAPIDKGKEVFEYLFQNRIIM